MSEFNAKSVNFNGAYFYSTNLCRARFTNCTFRNASFWSAIMDGIEFKDCNLEGACFANAKKLENVVVRDNTSIRHLTDYLDSEGYFHSSNINNPDKYTEDTSKKTVFISKLGQMNSTQQIKYNRIVQHIKDTYKDIELIYLDRCNYVKYGQLVNIREKMSYCSGVLVFAFSYRSAYENTKNNNENTAEKQTYSSPWIQIETAFANSIGIPSLIILEKDVIRDGIFDDKIVQFDALLPNFIYDDSLTDSDKEIIDDWYNLVIRHNINNKDKPLLPTCEECPTSSSCCRAHKTENACFD